MAVVADEAATVVVAVHAAALVCPAGLADVGDVCDGTVGGGGLDRRAGVAQVWVHGVPAAPSSRPWAMFEAILFMGAF